MGFLVLRTGDGRTMSQLDSRGVTWLVTEKQRSNCEAFCRVRSQTINALISGLWAQIFRLLVLISVSDHQHEFLNFILQSFPPLIQLCLASLQEEVAREGRWRRVWIFIPVKTFKASEPNGRPIIINCGGWAPRFHGDIAHFCQKESRLQMSQL